MGLSIQVDLVQAVSHPVPPVWTRKTSASVVLQDISKMQMFAKSVNHHVLTAHPALTVLPV